MARKSTPKKDVAPDWFLPEWMKTLGVNQRELGKRCDWPPATVNDIYHGKTNYYRDILNQVASALSIRPFELLLPPEEAMAIRRMRESAIQIAAEAKSDYRVGTPIEGFKDDQPDGRREEQHKAAS